MRRIAAGVVLIRLFGLSPNDRAEIITNAINKHADALYTLNKFQFYLVNVWLDLSIFAIYL
ncbi:MAG: hypothetical protein V7K97_11905 [Nostoc sp.]|uniref:hypothetical protein n=1 Tax=Nostoc sp. TaxID=1180 RepID=UPI002FFA17F7